MNLDIVETLDHVLGNIISNSDITDVPYLNSQKQAYLRTLFDVVNQFESHDRSKVTILEVGAFFGVVSIALRKLGFNVIATDIPEYAFGTNMSKLYLENDVALLPVNLASYKLPFTDETFDCLINCETLEHLNFNPLPVIAEFNRVLKPSGLLYTALPNQASLRNRLNLLQGHSIRDPIEAFFRQLDGTTGNIVGLHWREYTAPEIKEMNERMGFKLVLQYHEDSYGASCHAEGASKKLFGFLKKKLIHVGHAILQVRLLRSFVVSCLINRGNNDALMGTIVTIASKQYRPRHEFVFTAATRPQGS